MNFFTRPILSVVLSLVFMALIVGSIQTSTAEDPAPVIPGSPLVAGINAGLERDREEPNQLTPLGLTQCVGGMAGTYPCQNVDLLAFMPLATIGGGNGSANWGWTDITSGREFAIMGRSNGTAFVEITDPLNPVYLGNLPSHTGNSSWRELKTYSHYVYIVADNNGAHGMQVFDLNQLLTVNNPPVTFSESAHYAGVNNGHTITTNEATGYAFIFGSNTCSGGLHFVNIQNPLSPVGAGCFSADGYTHDAQCLNYTGPDPDHQGKELCFAYNTDTLTIVDVTNKAAPSQISRTGYVGRGYTHQGWLTDNQEYLLMDDELDEQNFGHNTRTYIWDVRNLDAPVLMGHFQAANAAIDHNQFFLGDYAFQANYRAGLRILDGSNIAAAQLSEVAYFDIYPTNNNASFNGAWHVYPYFPSGSVIVSGIEQGLFVLRPVALRAANESLNVCQTGSVNTQITVTSLFGNSASVTLTTQGAPTGATANLAPNPVTAPGTSQLTINTSNTPVGNYMVTVTGNAGSYTHTLDVNLSVQASNLTAPVLTTPANAATGTPLQPTFIWNAVGGATGYSLQVATDAAFSNIVLSETGLVNPTHTPATALNPQTTYYWRVQANGDCGNSPYSTVFSFVTSAAAPAAPTLVSPANGATSQALQPTFMWNAVSGADSYSLEVATDAGFSNVVITESGLTGTNYTPTSDLNSVTTYYWRVQAANGAGNSPYSTVYSFTTEEAAAAAHYLYLPIVVKP